ncbi:GbsR/MarR family transcriptional regulator [Candidatus Uabimicrobium sp. HlEnr_7]|uniref:GbsR/MarR family transcriptional regulator n=1 Tax=Candidatus Uabimicrobium helgolandensis TaxID=3095367 RepID=UPI0035578F96
MTSVNKIASWEKTATDAIGGAIEFWGFKRNHGRVWCLLYIKNRPFSAIEIQEHLRLSKGAVSMIVRELETWKVVHRLRIDDNTAWHFVAETNLLQMITHVVNQRETGVISHICEQLENANAEAKSTVDFSENSLQRLEHLCRLSFLFREMLNMFLKADNFDMLFFLEKVEEFKHTLEEQAKRD